MGIKSVGERGELDGFCATYGNVDRQGDVILPGAFTKSLAENGGKVKLLYQHSMATPVGAGTLVDTPTGLRIKAQLVLAVDMGREAWELVKAGVIDSFSIGYDVVRSSLKNGVRQLEELKLWEVSLVTVPANPRATINAFKNADADDLAAVQALVNQMAEAAAVRQLEGVLRKGGR
jgi:HK97 family phage prohead protease